MRDINGDGFPDIYVCNDFQTPDRIWLNDGRGHFRALPRLAMRKQSFSAMSVDFADIDRDGSFDFFVTEMAGRDHARAMRQLSTMAPVIPEPGRIENRPSVVRNTLFHNRGDGTYAEIAHFAGVAATDWTWQGTFLDVDLDGYEDLLIGNGTPFDVQDRDAANRIRALGQQRPDASRTNLVLHPSYYTANMAFRNRHDLTFEDQSDAWGFNSIEPSNGFAFADLDGDGDLDLAVNTLNSGPLLYRNDAAAPRLAVRLRGLHPNQAGIGGLVRVRGGPVPMQMQEILCGGHYLSCDEPMRVFAAGSISNMLSIEVTWRSGRRSTVADALPNRIYELDERAATTVVQVVSPPPKTTLFRDRSELLHHQHHDRLFNDYARQPLLMKQLSQLGPAAAWIDLDGDGHDELVIGTGKGGSVAVFRREPSGAFAPLAGQNLGPAPDDVVGLASWASADGQRSLLAGLASYESSATNHGSVLRLACEAGASSCRLASLTNITVTPASIGPLAVADLDGDGVLELFVGGRVMPGAYPRPTDSCIYRQQNGNLVLDATNSPVLRDVGLVSGAVWSDLDGDGFPELLLAIEWGPVKVFKNDRGRLRDGTAELGLAGYTGWWNGVTTGDLDGDGRLDIIASNWGMNDAYQASSEHPLLLYFGDLAGRGTVDLIESYYAPELHADVPRRSLNALAQAFPWLNAQYSTHEAFGKATIDDLLKTLPHRPQASAAHTLASIVFLNRGSNFLARPLPREAQFAPAFAANVADFDGDGIEDVFLSQNFFGMRPEWPRLDAGRGLLLLGDGTGQMRSMPGQDSGIEVYGEQRGAAVGDFNEDGRVDLVVSQNGTDTRLFENVAARPGLRVRLRGPAGNPDAIGAVLRLCFGERRGPAREIHAGSGYWSQDSLVQVLATPEPPTAIWIRWPGGRETTTPLPPTAREVMIDATGGSIR